MTAQEIRDLPIDEKVRIMQAIWEDMRARYEDAPISEEVVHLLKERVARLERGEARLLEWDSVKHTIGRG
jgi:putative addiction module component (TIGR02574 family)